MVGGVPVGRGFLFDGSEVVGRDGVGGGGGVFVFPFLKHFI